MSESKQGATRSFWLGTLAAVAIAVIAGIALSLTNPSAATKFSTPNVRVTN